MRISIIAAVAENGVIGCGGQLPWHLSDDLRRFKQLTVGHTIVMGRRTWESIGRALPGRRTVVVSRRPAYSVDVDGVQVAASLDAALGNGAAAGDDEVFIVGGAELYREALPRADRLYITRVLAHVAGDACFPEFDETRWRKVSVDHRAADAKNQYPVNFECHERA
jgi:dihydrofolate reductase